MAQILYFAWVREKIGTPQETIHLPAEVTTVQALMRFLRGKGDPHATALADVNLQVAVNQTHAQFQDPVADGDEIAIFPPVSGGTA